MKMTAVEMELILPPPNTVAWSQREWLQNTPIISRKFRVWVREPPLRKE